MVEAIWYLQQGQWMEQRNEGTETSDFAGRRGLGNMVRVEWGGAKSLQDCKEKDDRENCADEICNTRGISPASWWSIATVYPWPEETAGSSYAGRWCHRQGTTSSTSIPGRSTSSSEHKVAVSTKWYTIGTLHCNVSIVWWPCVALSTTAGKLTPRWEGNWTVKTAKSDQQITDGRRNKVVHINRLQHQIPPNYIEQLGDSGNKQ